VAQQLRWASVSSCPRCVRSIAPDAAWCPNCGYEIPQQPPAPLSAPPVVPATQSAAAPEAQPVIAATPWDQTGVIARVPEPRHRSWFAIVATVVAGIAVLIGISLVAVTRTHHTSAKPGHPAVGTVSTPPSRSPSSHPSSHPSNQDARTQAATIAGYLAQSSAARTGISAALTSIDRCTAIPAAVATLHNAATIRARIVGSLASTDVTAMPGGAALVADLRQALQASADADQHYAAWGQAMQACAGHPTHNADYTAAQNSDAIATSAKRRFTHAWNQLAGQLGMAQQDPNSI
jgi:hypothetical protein